MTGAVPSRRPDEEIVKLIERADADGVIRLLPRRDARPSRFAEGAKVQIVAGPFRSFEAIHTGHMAQERELILLELLGAQRQVAVDSRLVAARE